MYTLYLRLLLSWLFGFFSEWFLCPGDSYAPSSMVLTPLRCLPYNHKGGEPHSVGEHMKNASEKGGQNKSPCCVSWADETQAVSHEKTRQGSTPHHAKTSLEGIKKQNHLAKPHGQKIQKIREDMLTWPKDM